MELDPTKAEPTPEDIEHDMHATRAHLGDGVQALGDKAVGYAQDAIDAVGGAYEGTVGTLHGLRDAAAAGATVARHAAADGLAAVRRTLDVRRHTRRRPWTAMAVAVLAGFSCGRFLRRR